jgi:methylated-DNA-[protein]-cysteine S-methyltransferase
MSQAQLSTAQLSTAGGRAAPMSAAGTAELDWAWLADTPAGPVSVGCSPAGVSMVRFGTPPDGVPAGQDAQHGGVAAAARTQLAEYFCGARRGFELPIDWSVLVAAQRQVLSTLTESVGYGQTISYGELARKAGLVPTADTLPARVVGQIMAGNPIPIIVPCHRVLASDGLGGYSGGAGPEVKRWLLILEGSLPPTLDWVPARPLGD